MMYPLVLDLAADRIPVAVTCRVLGFSKEAFYTRRANPATTWDWDDAHLIHSRVASTTTTPRSGIGSSPTNSPPRVGGVPEPSPPPLHSGTTLAQPQPQTRPPQAQPPVFFADTHSRSVRKSLECPKAREPASTRRVSSSSSVSGARSTVSSAKSMSKYVEVVSTKVRSKSKLSRCDRGEHLRGDLTEGRKEEVHARLGGIGEEVWTVSIATRCLPQPVTAN